MVDIIRKKNMNEDIKIKDKIANPTPNEELLESLKEVEEMINNPKKYPKYDNWKDLKIALLSDK